MPPQPLTLTPSYVRKTMEPVLASPMLVTVTTPTAVWLSSTVPRLMTEQFDFSRTGDECLGLAVRVLTVAYAHDGCGNVLAE